MSKFKNTKKDDVAWGVAENINLDWCIWCVDAVINPHQFRFGRDGLFCHDKPWLQIGNFKSIPVFNKLQCAVLCPMSLRFSSILEFDLRKVGYLLRITVFFKNDNGAALPPQETWSPRCLYTLFAFKRSLDWLPVSGASGRSLRNKRSACAVYFGAFK